MRFGIRRDFIGRLLQLDHLRIFFLLPIQLDPASISAPEEEAPTAQNSQQVESLLGSSKVGAGLLLRGVISRPLSATGDGVAELTLLLIAIRPHKAEAFILGVGIH